MVYSGWLTIHDIDYIVQGPLYCTRGPSPAHDRARPSVAVPTDGPSARILYIVIINAAQASWHRVPYSIGPMSITRPDSEIIHLSTE